MKMSNYVLLNATSRRPARLVSKYRFSAEMDSLRSLRANLPEAVRAQIVDNDYGFMDKIQYNDAFGLAASTRHGICRLEDFIEFLQSLRSGRALNGDGEALSKAESDEILDDILAKKDSFGGKYKMHGERFGSRIIEEDGKVYLVSYAVREGNPIEHSREIAEYVNSQEVDPLTFNGQGFPTKKGAGWRFTFPEMVPGKRPASRTHAPIQFGTSREGGNILIGSYLGTPGILPGIGFRLVTSPGIIALSN